MNELYRLSKEASADDHVRIRYSVDQDFAHAIDKDKIKELFKHVEVLKVEGTINAVQSVRAKGIGTAFTTEEKLGYWAITTGDEDRIDELTERLNLLKSMDIEDIIESLKGVAIIIEPTRGYTRAEIETELKEAV